MRGGNPLADQVILHGIGPLGAQGDVVFARALFVGVAFDDDGIFRVRVQPLGLTVQDAARLIGDGPLIHHEMHAVAHGLVEIGHRSRVGRICPEPWRQRR